MITKALPHNLLAIVTEVSHLVMIGGAIALYLLGKIDSTALVAILGGFGVFWSGVAGALISTRAATPSTAPGGAVAAPDVPVTPVSPIAAVERVVTAVTEAGVERPAAPGTVKTDL